MKDVTALMVVGWALTLAACGGGPSATTTTTEAPEAATSTTVFVEPVTSTQQLNPGSFLDTPNEINLENNITVFFRRDAVAGVVEAESALRDLVGDRDIVSMQVLDRDEAWGTAQNIASLFPGGRLDPGDFDGLAQVARIFVVDHDVRKCAHGRA